MKREAPTAIDDTLTPSQDPQCEVCDAATRRYCCPACAMLTCSLACCVNHKETTGCTGKRDRTAFKSTSEFGEKDLRSDFHMLESINQGIDRVKRQRSRDTMEGRLWNRAVPLQPTMNRDQPPQPAPVEADDVIGQGALGSLAISKSTSSNVQPAHVTGRTSAQNKLVKAAAANGTTLLLMPSGMSRRAINTSCADKRATTVRWRIEFTFPANVVAQDVGVEVVVERASQDASWLSLLSARIASSSPSVQHTLRKHVSALSSAPSGPEEHFRLLLLKEPGAANAPQYYKLGPQQSLKESLTHKMVIEFPRVLVVLPEEFDAHALVPPRIEETNTGAEGTAEHGKADATIQETNHVDGGF